VESCLYSFKNNFLLGNRREPHDLHGLNR
jgi:hypothetical protein